MMRMIPSKATNVLGSGNRESLDIINLVLHVCANWTMKTHVMYKCNLNSKQVQEYLELMQKFGLVESTEGESGRTLYRTTEKGSRFVSIYGELLDIFGVETRSQLVER
jgi:predicted transcriptional regulator